MQLLYITDDELDALPKIDDLNGCVIAQGSDTPTLWLPSVLLPALVQASVAWPWRTPETLSKEEEKAYQQASTNEDVWPMGLIGLIWPSSIGPD